MLPGGRVVFRPVVLVCSSCTVKAGEEVLLAWDDGEGGYFRLIWDADKRVRGQGGRWWAVVVGVFRAPMGTCGQRTSEAREQRARMHERGGMTGCVGAQGEVVFMAFWGGRGLCRKGSGVYSGLFGTANCGAGPGVTGGGRSMPCLAWQLRDACKVISAVLHGDHYACDMTRCLSLQYKLVQSLRTSVAALTAEAEDIRQQLQQRQQRHEVGQVGGLWGGLPRVGTPATNALCRRSSSTHGTASERLLCT